MTEETLEALREFDLNEVYETLLIYAKIRIRKYRWPLGPRLLPEGYDAESIVQEAFKKFIEGERKWNCQKYPDFVIWMKSSVLRSLIGHLFNCEANKNEGPFTEDGLEYLLGHLDQVPQENSCYTARMSDEILKSVEGDEELMDLVECFLDGVSKPKQIAERMGLTPTQASRLKEKLYRRAVKIREKVIKESEHECER